MSQHTLKRKKFLWIAGTVAVVLVTGFIIFKVSGKSTVTVPDVTGKTTVEAEKILQGMKFKTARSYDLTLDSNSVDHVIEQHPDGGMEVYKKKHVMLAIGKAAARVPRIEEGTIENALRKSTAAGLRCLVVTSPEIKKKIEEYEPGTTGFKIPRVTSCYPEQHTIVEQNDTVTIYTENSSADNSAELSRSELLKIGIREDSLKSYMN